MSNKFDEFGIAEDFSKWCFDLKYKDIPYLCFSVDDYTNDDPYFMKDRMYYVCKEYLNKYNHPNPEGHKIWAQKVYDALNVPIGNMSVMDGVNAS